MNSKPDIVLYYKLYLDNETKNLNTIQTTLFSNVTGNGVPCQPKNSYFSGSGVRLMCDKNGIQNNNILFTTETETPENTLLGLPALINESFSIQTPTGFINFYSIYANNNIGDGITTIATVKYAVGANSGEFFGAKIATINFDNVNYTREIIISF